MNTGTEWVRGVYSQEAAGGRWREEDDEQDGVDT